MMISEPLPVRGMLCLIRSLNLPIEEREQLGMEGKVQQTICSCIEHLLDDELYEDAGKQSEEDEDEDDEGEENNEAEDKEEEQGEEAEEEVQEPEMQRQQFRVSTTARVCSSQVHQAQRVNRARAADGYKEFLQVFDVCVIAADETQEVPLIRGTFMCLSHK